MTLGVPTFPLRWRPALRTIPSGLSLGAVALAAVIGVEVAVLLAWLPETLRTWWRADQMGDFPMFYDAARDVALNGLYSPALSLLMHPLTYLSEPAAYRVYLALGMAATLTVAFLAQRPFSSLPVRVAVVLGIVTIPQLHWALRFGHLTPFLALFALVGFLLLPKRPVLAGLCFALLILKPQYLPVVVLYLLWTRRWRACAALAGGALGLQLLGFGIVGFDAMGAYVSNALDWGSDARDNLLPIQQAWQYSWPGFLISLGLDPHPLLVADLLVLSLAVLVLVWKRGDPLLTLPATAFSMVLLTPYANFYDWALLIVGAALLLRAIGRWPVGIPVLLGALYLALLVSQRATPWPVVDYVLSFQGTMGRFSLSPELLAGTRGIYWVTPLTLGVVGVLALVSRPGGSGASSPDAAPLALNVTSQPVRRVDALRRLALLVLVGAAAYLAAAFVAHVPPFAQQDDPFSRDAVLARVPPDFPLPVDAKVVEAGEGEQLPYHIVWRSEQPVEAVAALYERLLRQREWQLMLREEAPPTEYRIRLARMLDGRLMTHWAMLRVEPDGTGSRIALDFILIQELSLTFGEDPAGP